MKFIITGGGTGGHLAIASSLVDALIEDGHEAIFIGSTNGQDRSWFQENSSFSYVYFLNTSGVVNKKGLAKVGSLFNIIKAILKSFFILRSQKVQAVISVGGYSAAPASFASILAFKKLYIHEQNAKIGRLNSILKPFASGFFSSYESDSALKSYPVKEELFKTSRVRSKITTIIFLGGSQGAKAINDLALKVAPILSEKEINIIHQCGKSDYERVKNSYKELHIEVELFSFSNELEKLIERSDLAVSRSGASTLWELCAAKLPAFFVPYPYAAGDHQFFNAKFIVDNNLGWMMRENENLEEKLLSILDEDLTQKSTNLGSYISPNGAKDIIKQIIKDITK
ncbi:MAG: undecaprenyldiphospho-muramoylpentapeptide beta-N-acetylglucosaminyltransferase [Helicobacteraceae bacterium]|nr:undecaprenyldiphospho-muramoylpentapeptide beta-N-acetylglucosaminyltransferase [Helicobacteraceae bacterium]